MGYNVTLLRFMILTSQDCDEHGWKAPNWLGELSHWFSPETLAAHEHLLYSMRILNDPDVPYAWRRTRLTRLGRRIAACLRDERDWRSEAASVSETSDRNFRTILSRAIRRRRGRVKPELMPALLEL